MNMKKEIIVTNYDSSQLIDCIRNGIKALNIDKNNVKFRDTKNLENYVNSAYRDAPLYRLIINAYKGDLKIPNTTFINKAFRYELDGCIVVIHQLLTQLLGIRKYHGILMDKKLLIKSSYS